MLVGRLLPPLHLAPLLPSLPCSLTSPPHLLTSPLHPQFYKLREPRRWVTSGGLGSMGFGLPSALGAAAAFDGRDGRPAKIVVDIDGDGRWAPLLALV